MFVKICKIALILFILSGCQVKVEDKKQDPSFVKKDNHYVSERQQRAVGK